MAAKRQRVTADIIAEFRAGGASAGMQIWPFRNPNGDEGWIVDAANGKPAREVRSGCFGRSTGTFASRKANLPLEWESENERAALRICEYDPRVREIRTQPFTVVHQSDSRLSRTYPDIEVVMVTGERKIIQVKYAKALKDPKIADRLERERVGFKAHGWSYEIWTQDYVRQEPRYETLKAIHHFRSHQPNDADVIRVREYLSMNGPQKINMIRQLLGRERSLEAVLMPLIARRIVEVDLMQPLNAEADVYLVT